MARGGARPGAGRPKGSRERLTVELEKWCGMHSGTLIDQLDAVVCDEHAPKTIRIEALGRAFAALGMKILREGAGNAAQVVP